MKCPECQKTDMKPAHWQYRDQVDDSKKVYFPNTWWVRASAHTWKEIQPHICPKCGAVKAVPTGRSAVTGPEKEETE